MTPTYDPTEHEDAREERARRIFNRKPQPMTVNIPAGSNARRYGAHPEELAITHFANGSSPSILGAVVIAPGNSWGGAPLTFLAANAPTANVVANVQAYADEAVARGLDVVYIGYPKLQGSSGATVQQGTPHDSGVDVVDSFVRALGYVRARYTGAIYAVGRSASGITFAEAAGSEPIEGLIALESAPNFVALDDSAPFAGAPAYCTGAVMPWSAVTTSAKQARSMITHLTGAAVALPFAGVYADDITLVSTNDFGTFSVLYGDGTVSLAGYSNPHDEGGGAIIDCELEDREALTWAFYGGVGVTGHPTGAFGSPMLGQDATFASDVFILLGAPPVVAP